MDKQTCSSMHLTAAPKAWQSAAAGQPVSHASESRQSKSPADIAPKVRSKRPTDPDLRLWLAIPDRQQSANRDFRERLAAVADRQQIVDKTERYADTATHRQRVCGTLALIPIGFALGMLSMALLQPGRPQWQSSEAPVNAFVKLGQLCDQLGAPAKALRRGFTLSEVYDAQHEWTQRLRAGSWANAHEVRALSESWLASCGNNTLLMISMTMLAFCLLGIVLHRLCAIRRDG